MFTDRKNRQKSRCSHPERLRTENFGLERLVCVECGDVEMRNQPGEVVVQADSLKAAAASRR